MLLPDPSTGSFVNDWFDIEAAARQSGRRVSVTDLFEDLLLKAVEAALIQGLKEVAANAIIQLPRDRSAEYQGSLPQYAQVASRDRVVHIHCKGKCKAPRLAEMEQAYPGAEPLRKSNVGDFKARCLRCGSIARDGYNWHR